MRKNAAKKNEIPISKTPPIFGEEERPPLRVEIALSRFERLTVLEVDEGMSVLRDERSNAAKAWRRTGYCLIRREAARGVAHALLQMSGARS